jgi:hypothetical protein
MDCEWISWCSLKPEAQAAWVQAVGSIAAVAVAVAVPLGLYLKDRGGRLGAERRNQSWFSISLLPVLARFERKLGTFVLLHDSEEGEVLDASLMDFNYESDIPVLIELLQNAPPMPGLDEQLTGLAKAVFDLQTTLDDIVQMQAGGLHSAWINQRDDVLEEAREIIRRLRYVGSILRRKN